MNIEFFKRNWQILLLNLLVVSSFIIGYGRFGDVIFDSFREVYIPGQMLKGQILYKNIFNIYAPFSYLFNAFICKIFGTSLNIFYVLGLFGTIGITNLIFQISNKFLDKKYSFGITLFFICATVLSPNVFNCFLPYSYGMLYGLFFVLVSIYFGLNKQFTLAYLMYSFSICSKYEFILLLPILIVASFKNKSRKHIIALFIPIITTLAILFAQGVRFEDLLVSTKLILTMSGTKTLYWFYSVTGLVFRPQIIPIYLMNIIKIAIPIVVLFFIKNKYYLLTLPLVFVYCYFISTPEVLIYIFPLILVLYLIRFKSLSAEEKLFIPACVLISSKVFFALTLQSYGVYFIPLALISVFLLTPEKLKKSVLTVILLCAISLGIKNINTLYNKNVKLSTEKVYANPYYGNSINELIDYINKNTKKTDRVVIYPECLSVNVLAKRDSDNKFYSLIPLYVETFGDELIIKRLEIKQPEYIVISNIDTSNYYYMYFGFDYAEKILEYVLSNYDYVGEVGEELKFNIYRLKSHHPSQPRA